MKMLKLSEMEIKKVRNKIKELIQLRKSREKQKCYFVRTVELLVYLTEHKAAYVKDILTGEIINVNASRVNIDNGQLFITEEVLA